MQLWPIGYGLYDCGLCSDCLYSDAHIVMAYIDMTYTVMAYKVMAYVDVGRHCLQGHHLYSYGL